MVICIHISIMGGSVVEEKKTKATFTINEQLLQDFRVETVKQGKKMSNVVEELIKEYLNSQKRTNRQPIFSCQCAKAKANLIQGLEEIIHIARKTKETDNAKMKNRDKAKFGWFRYLTRFALPVMDENDIITHYNIFLATLVVRKDSRKKLFLYDVVNIKKECERDFRI